jgi:hypothetical protein
VKVSTFVTGLVVLVALMVGGIVVLFNLHGTSRPEGVAENWLTDVGDTTRKGVEADARKRAEKTGPVALARDLIYPDGKAINRKTGFADLEVGKAVRIAVPQPVGVSVEQVEVGFRVHALQPNDEKKEITGVLTLVRHDEWRVVQVRVGDLTGVPALPSDGGPPPSSAPLSLWLGGLVGAAIIGVITASLVRLAGRPAPVPVTA